MPFIILSSSHPSLLTAKALKPSIHAMKDRPTLSSYGAIYVPPHHRLRSVITSANYNSSAPSVAKLRDHHGAALNPRPVASAAPTTVHRSQTTLPEQIPVKGNSRFVSAYDDVVSEEGSDREFEAPSFRSASPNDNVDEWMRKLTLLLNDKSKQELLSREKKDRRDFDQIALLASRMGLYSHMYAKVVVFSKVPLPNYRYDLDDRRPQREVSMPITLLRRVDAYFEEHLTRKSKMKESFSDVSFTRSSSNSSIGTDEGLFEHPEPLASSKAVGEKILRRRSLQMHDQQQAWQVTSPKI